MIKGRNPGDNITLLNSMFIQGTNPSNGKFEQVMTLVYKDLDSGMKHVEEIIDPDYEYYIAAIDTEGYGIGSFQNSVATAQAIAYDDLDTDNIIQLPSTTGVAPSNGKITTNGGTFTIVNTYNK